MNGPMQVKAEAGMTGLRKNEPLLIPLAGAAGKLGISRQSLRRQIKQGQVDAVRIGRMRKLLISQVEIDRIVNGRPKLTTVADSLTDSSQTVSSETNSSQTSPERTERILTTSERLYALIHGDN